MTNKQEGELLFFLKLTKYSLLRTKHYLDNLLLEIKNEYIKRKINKKILNTNSVKINLDDSFEVSILTSHNDLTMLILALKSFLFFSGLKPKVKIFSDGSLNKQDIEIIKRHFNGCVVYTKSILIKRIAKVYGKKHKFMSQINNPSFLKHIAPFMFDGAKKILFFDSDLLFYARPTHINRWLKGDINYLVMRDCQDAYLMSQIEAKAIFHRRLFSKLNSGFFGVDRNLVDLYLLEKIVDQCLNLSLGRTIKFQTFFSLLVSANKGVILTLPSTYLVTENKHKLLSTKAICKHFITPMRKFYFGEATKILESIES